MRRLDLHPMRRLRNPGRHLRALERWPERIADQLPAADELAGSGFWNFKIPVYAKLVEPPQTRPDFQTAALAALFAAAEAVERSPRRPADVRVACMATTPWMFESEVTLFADDDYFRSFLPPKKLSRSHWEEGWVDGGPADLAEMITLSPPTPDGLVFHGGTAITECALDGPDAPRSRVLWIWSYPRR